MDSSKNRVLKENDIFLVADESGQIVGGEHGLYCRDTRFLSRYRWDLGEGTQALLAFTPRPDRFRAHHARIEGPSQLVGYSRSLELESRLMLDTLTVENSSGEARTVEVALELAADFVDMFEARGWMRLERGAVRRENIAGENGEGLRFAYEAKDGLVVTTELRASPPPEAVDERGLRFRLELEPKESRVLEVRTTVHTGAEPAGAALPSYDDWRHAFNLTLKNQLFQEVINQAIDDLRALLIVTEHGPFPAAGIPWYVAAFGRDALLTAIMMLPWRPDVAEGTLRYLAAHQGRGYVAFRAEAPGKIMHERRYGELTRLGRTPHGPYYGTVDATPLFIVLLHETWKHTGRLELVEELKPSWEAALAWLEKDGDADGDGFLEFAPAEVGKGLAVQSWKDSHDSMSHKDGSLAQGALAVSEVQGYTYAAFMAAADFAGALGDAVRAEAWRERAKTLQARFHRAFWLENLQTYAMALDGDKRPLEVLNSDAGQLLWTGVVPQEVAPRLVKTLMSDALFSGWGVRTLGSGERRYNPVSYHNGSVWPHDTALIAGGMARYGFHQEAARLCEALYSLAASQADRRLPELVAGYVRQDEPPVPYPVACRPQAWDAAALLYLLRLAPG
ncbi:MAG: amylo-alpha-1,6-glucosidase [Deinococcota bacterium]|nr:amylo-alpha-1,6-glucosidase [Deinococcota bacterium]